jgi:hypothetical protein
MTPRTEAEVAAMTGLAAGILEAQGRPRVAAITGS